MYVPFQVVIDVAARIQNNKKPTTVKWRIHSIVHVGLKNHVHIILYSGF